MNRRKFLGVLGAPLVFGNVRLKLPKEEVSAPLVAPAACRVLESGMYTVTIRDIQERISAGGRLYLRLALETPEKDALFTTMSPAAPQVALRFLSEFAPIPTSGDVELTDWIGKEGKVHVDKIVQKGDGRTFNVVRARKSGAGLGVL